MVGLDVPENQVDFEVPLPEVRGRMDGLFGSTVFEFKRDLRAERDKAEEQLERYLGDRERSTGRRFLGIATDGAEFLAYELRNGNLCGIDKFVTKAADPRGLLTWLDTAVTVREHLDPDPEIIRAEFGRDSLVFLRAIEELRDLWEGASGVPEAELKRDLWGRHLEFVYGKLIEPEQLFLQHTYLTIVAKTMAVRVLVSGPMPAGELLDGTPFTEVGLNGAIEADFFNWILLVDGGADLVDRVASQVSRFRLSEIKVDVLKAIYESLIDPQQRQYLGEYYTPDWLADWMCEKAVVDPLSTRVFDPACGSGTFLFHSVRRYLEAAEADKLPLQEALEGCTDHVLGLDVHPVAVLFARVTYLLAIGAERLSARSGELFIPVYLGDALQWSVRQLFDEEEIEITVPNNPSLRFPGSVAGDPKLLDSVLQAMRKFSDQGAPTRSFQSWMNAHTTLPSVDRDILTESYERMRALHEEGRNHIWTYVVRNLTRPLWLSLRKGKPDVVIGNPPWLKFNAMSGDLQARFREASRQRGLWVGGKFATHQDLSAYFFARSVERYLPRGGVIAFVMPYASLTRGQYEGFRTGTFADQQGTAAAVVQFDEVWTFDSDVKPLFRVPAAVVFAHRNIVGAELPRTVEAFRGNLPRRDATPEQARGSLTRTIEPWPIEYVAAASSPYRRQFKQGATIVPRRLMVVAPVESGQFGGNPNAPLVESRVGSQDKFPWKEIEPLRGQVEQRFLRPLLLGESITPFRVIRPLTAVIPWDGRRRTLLDAEMALDDGHLHLAAWLQTAERLWSEQGSSTMSLAEQLDYYGKLSGQFPIRQLRVVYAKAGVLPAAAVVEDDRAIIDHKLYWMAVSDSHEARYLTAILNSETARQAVQAMQSMGQFGPRDFDKAMLSLPIPRFNRKEQSHRALVSVAKQAEQVADAMEIPEGQYFVTARKKVRKELERQGVAALIESLVGALLNLESRSTRLTG